jgi:hypothetical protein
MASGKDSTEVVRFMSLFARLKDWIDDDPVDLAALAQSDDSVRHLCDELSLAACVLARLQRHCTELFAAPVDPKFIEDWRQYEERYASKVTGIWLSRIYLEREPGDSSKPSALDLEWENADDEASDQASAIEKAIDFAQVNADQHDRWEPEQEGWIRSIKEGVDAWTGLQYETGFDLRGVFRRRALIPFILVPRHVASKYGNSAKLSLFKHLKQAHNAFVFGATYGALALMRSILEVVLRDHYKAEGRDLEERIRGARARLPPSANEAALHRLRKLANAILHQNSERHEGLLQMDDVQLEKEIVSLLFVLRALIENAK